MRASTVPDIRTRSTKRRNGIYTSRLFGSALRLILFIQGIAGCYQPRGRGCGRRQRRHGRTQGRQGRLHARSPDVREDVLDFVAKEPRASFLPVARSSGEWGAHLRTLVRRCRVGVRAHAPSGVYHDQNRCERVSLHAECVRAEHLERPRFFRHGRHPCQCCDGALIRRCCRFSLFLRSKFVVDLLIEMKLVRKARDSSWPLSRVKGGSTSRCALQQQFLYFISDRTVKRGGNKKRIET